MAVAPPPVHTRRRSALLGLTLLVAPVLLAGACSDDDAGDDTSEEADQSTPSTEAGGGDGDGSDDSTTTTSDDGSGGGVGTVELDGESYGLDSITGITSCDFEDPDGDFTVAADSDDGEVFFRLDSYASDPDSNELSVTVGEVEYVAASATDVAYEVDDRTVSGTVAVEPLFEEGTAQDVTFEVTCP